MCVCVWETVVCDEVMLVFHRVCYVACVLDVLTRAWFVSFAVPLVVVLWCWCVRLQSNVPDEGVSVVP